MGADAAGQRRRHLRELEIELGISDRRLGGLDRRGGATLVGETLIDVLNGAVLGLLQLLRAPKLRVGECRSGLCGAQLRHRLIKPDLERPRIDREQRIALFDDLPVAKADGGQLAADLGAQFNRVDRRELAEKNCCAANRGL